MLPKRQQPLCLAFTSLGLRAVHRRLPRLSPGSSLGKCRHGRSYTLVHVLSQRFISQSKLHFVVHHVGSLASSRVAGVESSQDQSSGIKFKIPTRQPLAFRRNEHLTGEQCCGSHVSCMAPACDAVGARAIRACLPHTAHPLWSLVLAVHFASLAVTSFVACLFGAH